MRYDQIKTSAEEMSISLPAAVRMRIRYLQNLIKQWDDYIDEKTNVMPESSTVDIVNEMVALQKGKEWANKPLPTKGIDDEMIERARAYPIQEVVEFHGGMAIAFCHEDKRPSLTWHKAKNRATCFPCGKSYSALDILISRDGMSFIDAVKQLGGR